ncbi:MAG: core protein [Dasosvirus sp.]|uniref:Core protein n=1 Tax=Dasosvirus sp. TaxID=2487764 RepID=A0A3G4ZR84_9VIRU|nr:MAG: core protein [Dasosvirus sp.]
MSSKPENYHRNTTDDRSKGDADYFAYSDTPIEQYYNILKLQGKSDKEIDAEIDRVKEKREYLRKVIRKFMGKINEKYGHLDIPELMNKGMKYMEKYGLPEAAKKMFRRELMKGDIHNVYSYNNELKYSQMSKFFGFDTMSSQMLRVQPKDHAKLNELNMLYDSTRHIHADLKNQTYNYRDCAPQAINGTYDRTKHNVAVHIHPVIAALFFPKVEYLEKRMLFTNIARMILSRGQAYLNNLNFQLSSNVAPGELDAEFELAYDIAMDPNALAYFSEDSPLDNIIKRFRVQIELYMNVLNLRQGRYYSTGYEENDGISGFLRIINSYDWTFFDSPDLYNVQDEGTVLRKLLAVFSCRPTFTQLSSFVSRTGMGYTTITNLAKTTYVNVPIVNIKLPVDIVGNVTPALELTKALYQTDHFIEHRMVVPKNKSVIYSNEVAFFYANRRFPAINFSSINPCMTMRYVGVPASFINTTTINTAQIQYEDTIRIGRDWFQLRSVVLLQRPPISGLEIATGCSAAIVVSVDSPSNPAYAITNPAFIHYNPSVAAIQTLDPALPLGATRYTANTPVTFIDELTHDPNKIGFRTEAQERGTIFFYVKLASNLAPC